MNYFEVQKKEDKTFLICHGDWIIYQASKIEKEFNKLSLKAPLIIDVSMIKNFDSAGVIEFITIYKRLIALGKVEVIGYNQKEYELFKLLEPTINIKLPHKKSSFLEDLGKASVEALQNFVLFLHFLGETFAKFFYFLKPKNFRYKEMVYHIYTSGVGALFIIALTSFLVGMVVAYQASVQLHKFGADIFIVDTIGISVTRELAPLITAIVVAGRSGSSYTAEIGAMKITEEINAMKSMGFDVYAFLVWPRIFALVISLPLLTFFADIVGIYGGLIASKFELGISFSQFVERLYEVLKVKHYILGLIKTPVFAATIALIGCFRGFLVSDNTQSIGLQTTASVVNSIFLVIAFDALFSVIYTELGI